MGGPGGGAPRKKTKDNVEKIHENQDFQTQFLKGGILRHFSTVEI